MEDKKKVKYISSAKEKLENLKSDIDDKKMTVSDSQIIRDYESNSKNKIKYIIAFLLGILATIALFTFLGGRANTNGKNNSGNSNEMPYLGIYVVNLEDTDALNYYDLTDINTTLKKGVVVESVNKYGSAYKNLKKGDIITAVNNVTVSDYTYLRYELYKHYVGEKIAFAVERNGKMIDVTIVLKAKK